jgi:hypothetical protein
LYAIFVREKVRYVFADLRRFQVRKSQKKLGPQIANPRKEHLRNVRKINKFLKSAKFADLLFAKLICDRPPQKKVTKTIAIFFDNFAFLASNADPAQKR